MKELCLQQRTGSCRGCNILELARNLVVKRTPGKEAAQQVQQQYCPEGSSMQTESLQPRVVARWGGEEYRSTG